MHKTRWHSLLQRLIGVGALLSTLLFTIGTGASAQMPAQGAAQPGLVPLAAGGQYYYYVDGERVPLTPSMDWVSVRFVTNDPAGQVAALAASGAPLDLPATARRIPNPQLSLWPLRPGVTADSLALAINAMRAKPDTFLGVDPVFQTSDAEMVMTDEFIATFPADKSLKEIDALNASHGVERAEAVLGQEHTFVLKVRPGSRLDSLAMANLYQESGMAIHAAPDFVRILSPDPGEPGAGREPMWGPLAATDDPWYSDQWALNNVQQYGAGMTYDADIDAPEAWDVSTGSPLITIAVIDEGVELSQEDLSAKLVAGYDATGRGSAGGPCSAPCGNEDDAHGTNVAGLAAASSNNSMGIAGVCQQCRIMPVRIAYGDGYGYWIAYDSWIANGIAWAYQQGADILSNSWGGGSPSTVINTAIANARALGRGGKGSVVVFAAGNQNASSVSYPASLSNVIAVAASNMCDRRKAPIYDLCNGYEGFWGSNYGSALDISAPGVWLDATDRMGSAGYSIGNYYNAMNGTSGATPIVSGVAGLVLSINPNLTANQVQTILQITADDVNGGGWDKTMGYGRVNAYRAVTVAASSSAVFQSTAGSDGWVLESAETSNKGGAMKANGAGFNLGDDASNRQYRAILSFDTALPSGAVISSVTLQIKKAGQGGNSPFTVLGNLVADIKTGYFGTKSSLQLGDFQATPTVKNVLMVPNAKADGWYTGVLNPAYFGYVNIYGSTQFRLRFSKDDNNNRVADYLKYYSGNAAAWNRPVLTITYYMP